MSCEWRRTSHDQWELTQSNPPSELLDDPIVSTSSNPDERSSSPTTRSRMSPNSRNKPGDQTGESQFTNAAQAETEPIPRDNDFPNPEDMLNPDSSSFASDFGEHIALRQANGNGAEIVESPELDSKKVPSKKNIRARRLDSDDEDFEILKSDGQGSDSSYVEEKPKRRGKKAAPSKKVRSKAHSKPRTVARGSNNYGPAIIKDTKQPSITKGQPRKANTAFKTSSKQIEPATKAPDTQTRQKPTTKHTAKAVETANPASRRIQGAHKGKDVDLVIPDSQAALPSQEKQVARRLLVPRLPKKSFYNELESGPSTQLTPETSDNVGPQLKSNFKGANGQSTSAQNHVPSASPVRGNYDDIWCPPSSPDKQEGNLLPEDHGEVAGEALTVVPNAAAGPNSKKKRGLAPVQLKSGNTRKGAMRTYGQKPPQNSGSNGHFRELESREAEAKKQSRSASSKQLQDQQEDIPRRTAKPRPTGLGAESRSLRDGGKEFEQECTQARTTEEPVFEVIDSDSASKQSISVAPTLPGERTPPKLRGTNSQTLSKKQKFAPASVVNIVDEMERTATQTTTFHINPENPRESSECRNKEANIEDHLSKDTRATHCSSHFQQKITEQISGRAEALKELSKEKPCSAKQIHPTRPSPDIKPSQRMADTSDVLRDSGDISMQPQTITTPPTGRRPSPEKTNTYQKIDTSPVEIIQYSKVGESRSPLAPLNTTTRNMAHFGRNPVKQTQQPSSREERFRVLEEPRGSTGHDMEGLPWNPQVASGFGLHSAQQEILPPVDRVQPQTHIMTNPKISENLENRRPTSNHVVQSVMSPSTNIGYSPRDRQDFVPPVPKLNPKSVDFARRVAQGQKQIGLSEEIGQEIPVSEESYHSIKRLSRPQYQVPVKRRDEYELQRSETDKVAYFNRGRSSKEYSQRSIPSSRPRQDIKWQDAVEAASTGVVDALHLISMNILGHLRTREQSVFAIIQEYKRNGTRISARLAKRQAEEWLNVSAASGQKCSELATMYGELSKEAQQFRAKCLSKHREQAYTEWQRQTARVKAALRTARQDAELG
ncbi:hypothetical protein F5Y04DRAFT_25354 [Hypomontagnella monticulosa]|nr:hypothetical protein F5Y04DRAFT_25354 [Hypomontagnella monticulosa]